MPEGGKKETVSDDEVNIAYAIMVSPPTGTPTDKDDRMRVEKVLKNATKKQIEAAREAEEGAGALEGMNMGGVVKDELGYMNGGMGYNQRGPIKYSKGGAVKGKNYKGSY